MENEQAAEFTDSVQSYLQAARLQALSSSVLLSPHKIFFDYLALLISALNHQGDSGCRFFIDYTFLPVESAPHAWTTLPDVDREVFPLFAHMPGLAERLGWQTAEQSAPEGCRYTVASHTFAGAMPDLRQLGAVELRLGVVAEGRPEPFFPCMAAQIERNWRQLLHDGAKRCQLNPVAPQGQVRGWPESIEPDSTFFETAHYVYDELREAVSHVARDLAALTGTTPGGADGAAGIFFVRKRRYCSAQQEGLRRVVQRRVGKAADAHEDYLLSYFFSSDQLYDLKQKLKESAEREILAKRYLERHGENPRVQHLVEALRGSDEGKRFQTLLDALEIPQGEDAAMGAEVMRSVSDTCFITGAPEIVWDVGRDKRYLKEFSRSAEPVLVACEQWLWEGMELSGRQFVFLPLRAGGDTIVSAYITTDFNPESGTATGMERLRMIAHGFVQAQQTYLHLLVDLYFTAVVEVFEKQFLAFCARHAYRNGAESVGDLGRSLALMNEGCRAIHLILGLPEVQWQLGRGAANHCASLWECYQDVARDVWDHESHHRWQKEERQVFFLDEISVAVPGALRSWRGETFFRKLVEALGQYVSQHLWDKLATIKASRDFGHSRGEKEQQDIFAHQTADHYDLIWKGASRAQLDGRTQLHLWLLRFLVQKVWGSISWNPQESLLRPADPREALFSEGDILAFWNLLCEEAVFHGLNRASRQATGDWRKTVARDLAPLERYAPVHKLQVIKALCGLDWTPPAATPAWIASQGFTVALYHALWQAVQHGLAAALYPDRQQYPRYVWLDWDLPQRRVVVNNIGVRSASGGRGDSRNRRFFDLLQEKSKGIVSVYGPDRIAAPAGCRVAPEYEVWQTAVQIID